MSEYDNWMFVTGTGEVFWYDGQDWRRGTGAVSTTTNRIELTTRTVPGSLSQPYQEPEEPKEPPAPTQEEIDEAIASIRKALDARPEQ